MFRLGGKKVIGVEITDEQLKLVEISRNKKQKVITKYAIEDLPSGLIQNGIIQNTDELHQILKKIKRKLKLGNRDINLSINSPNILLRPFQMPKMDKKLLRKAIEMEIENNIQLPFQQFTYDYALIPERENDPIADIEEQTQELMLIIAAKEMLNTYISIFMKVNLEVVSIDLAPISFLRLLELKHNRKIEQLFIGINLHQQFAEVSIFSDAVLRLSRNIPFNPQNYVLSNVIDDRSPDIKPLNYEAYNADLIREVERIINFYRYTLHHRDQVLSEIILAGSLPLDTEQVLNALSTYFQVPCLILAADHVDVHGKVSRGYAVQAPMLTIPLGLALKDVRA